MPGDSDIKTLLEPVEPEDTDDVAMTHVLRRVRTNVAQRDTLLFAIVRIWTALADMLAPLFAAFAQTHAKAQHGRALRQDHFRNQEPPT